MSRSDRAVANRLTASYSRAVSVLTVIVLEKSSSGQGNCDQVRSVFLELYCESDRKDNSCYDAPQINQFTENVETEKYN